MDIDIRYNHGHGYMQIHMEAFFGDRNITRVRKLLNIIRTSDTPECEQQIREYIDDFNNVRYPTDKSREQEAIARYEANICDLQADLDGYLAKRDAEKKSTAAKRNPEYDKWNDQVYECRGRLSDKKASLKKVQRELNNTERDKVFLAKCLELLQ